MSVRFTKVAASALALALVAGAACAAPPKDLDAYVGRAISTFDAPGMSVAIVEDGKAVLAKGYGVRKLGDPAKVDEHTIFPIGSNTKAFTATALGMLTDEGKLSWDDKVESKLPGFRMYDSYATGEMTVTDLLTHRSGLGLGEGDLMIFPQTDFTRQEVVEHLRYLKPARAFRGGYAYDNVLYIAAGQLVESVSHEKWEDFIHQRIFAPLGMTDSTATFGEITPAMNRAWPHWRTDGPMNGVGGHERALDVVDNIDVAAPAGSINASASDLAKWLLVQLGHGTTPDGKHLFSDKVSAALWTPQTLEPTPAPSGPLAATQANFQAYALGFNVRDYHGHKIITHGGGVIGGISIVVLIPDKNVGFAVMTNSMESGALGSVAYKLLDYYTGAPATDWVPVMKEGIGKREQQAIDFLKDHPADAGGGPAPSLPLAKFAGTYRDAWYGTITVSQAGQGLKINFDRSKGMDGPLEPVRYNTFRTRFSDTTIENAYVTFDLGPDGSIERVSMKPISPLADFSFDYQDLDFRPEKGK
jgi:CubicO group peptidase (beta-lactamase class C family)